MRVLLIDKIISHVIDNRIIDENMYYTLINLKKFVQRSLAILQNLHAGHYLLFEH